ncbi:hypothetical protein IHQ71_18885 [Rhizobium sp. TH2]|uniref:FitA-like ribbon-helix-helix domain-containing protein n=1 Tax=Rhizobium sp. TH2 TaxID=2775403 RepID=UPI002158934E|nr:hypothetical protein [Rhizobium sp. TH2]UVC07271.1 hypothetical protein IHQ71_18885 [Rhizobium sp. TH2]
MVDITIEISDEALRALEEQAAQNGRSLNDEMLHILHGVALKDIADAPAQPTETAT